MASQAEKLYVPSFHFNKPEPCYCGSGLSFGECCASSAPDRPTPKYIQIIHNFIPPAECKRFLRFAKKQPRSWLTVIDPHKSSPGKSVTKRDPRRVTQTVDLGKKAALVKQWIESAVRQYVSKIGRPEWFETPQLLRYEPGGKYASHADGEDFDSQQKQYFRLLDRDFSFLIYTNDDYEGGEIYFNHLDFTYKPAMGDLVIFPSNHIFNHESRPVTSGTKYAIVSWGAFAGTHRVGGIPAHHKNFIK